MKTKSTGRWRPDLAHLDAFVAVHEERGFRKAAERLGISQPAISYRVSALEAQLGARLFEEPRRRVILTPEGRSLLRVSTRILEELASLGGPISDHGSSPEPLTIACPGAFGRNVVFPALSHGDLRDTPVELRFRTLDDIFDLVESGAVDLGIAYGLRVTDALQFHPLIKEEFCLVASRDTSLPLGGELDVLEGHPFVTYEECSYVFGKWFEDVFGRQPTRLVSASSFSRVEEVLATVASGRGLSIVPVHSVIRWRAGADVADSALSIWRPAGRPRSYNQEYAVTRPGWTPWPQAERLLEIIQTTGNPEDES